MRRGAWAGLALFVLVLGLAPLGLSAFYVTLLDYIGLYALAALGLVLLTGVGGLTSFGQAAFVGIGAYTTAVLSTRAETLPAWLAWIGASPWLTLAAGLLITLVLASVLGAVTLRLSGHYLPLGTIAWALSLYYAFGSVPGLGGHSGIADIPPIRVAGLSLDSGGMYYLIWIFLLLALWTTRNLLDSRPGRALRSLRGGRVMAESMGIDTARARGVLFVIAALQACASGWLYAHMQRFVNPSPFGLQMGIEYLFMVVIGGAGHVWGAVCGAALLTIAKQWLQDWLPRLLGQNGNFEIIVFGLGMVLVLHRARGGLWPALARWFPSGWPVWCAAPAGRERQSPQAACDSDSDGDGDGDGAATALPLRARPAPGSVVLDVRGVTRRFGGLIANDAISLQVEAAQIVALIGPNGAGKSTLFNQISGVDRPTSGSVHFLGDDVTGRPARVIAARGMSRTFQHVRLLRGMTALENTAIGAHLRGRHGIFAAAWRANRAEETRILAEAARQLRRVGLGAHLHDDAHALALGRQRIVEIARALASDPCLLLLDEPAAGLRHQEKQALAALLRALRAEGMAVLLVEHDMDFVMGLADRVVVMDFGVRIAEGRPDDVRRDPAVLEAYLGGVDDDSGPT
jgi:branched-chain amino acid transport system permease protein